MQTCNKGQYQLPAQRCCHHQIRSFGKNISCKSVFNLKEERRTPSVHIQASSAPLVEECSVSNWRTPLRCDASPNEGASDIVVALGKFDAMHLGHRSLAVKASEGGRQPVLLSFSGMAAVLGWPTRLSLTAGPDRPRVLSSWAQHCNGRAPRQRIVPFKEIRNMSPEEFVSVLATELGAAGVVAGRNYRFGYKAAGDAAALQTLGARYGMQVHIVDLVQDELTDSNGSTHSKNGTSNGGTSSTFQNHQISSSKIRDLLDVGDTSTVASLLGRPYRLVCHVEASTAQAHSKTACASIPASTFLNMPPAPGRYKAFVAIVSNQSRPQSTSSTGSGSSTGQVPDMMMTFWEDECINLPSVRSDQTTQASDTTGSEECEASFSQCTCVLTIDGLQLDERILETLQRTAGSSYIVVDFVTC